MPSASYLWTNGFLYAARFALLYMYLLSFTYHRLYFILVVSYSQAVLYLGVSFIFTVSFPLALIFSVHYYTNEPLGRGKMFDKSTQQLLGL
jgi:hypothetical protein